MRSLHTSGWLLFRKTRVLGDGEIRMRAYCLWNVKWCSLRKAAKEAIQKIKIELLYDPGILLRIFIQGIDVRISKRYEAPVFIAEVFVIAKMWKKT